MAPAPCDAARDARARIPRQGRRLPSRPSSPAHQSPFSSGASSCPLAANRARAMGRSKAGPSLRKSAGARLTTTRTSGPRKPLFLKAARTRSRDSWVAASGRPTIWSPGSPGARSTSTVTGKASRPSKEALWQRASIAIGAVRSVNARPVSIPVPHLLRAGSRYERRHDLWSHPAGRHPLR